MKNETNIYDIDGKLIRAAGDNHQFTIEEVEKLIDYYAEKSTQQPENQAYRAYLNNLYMWLNRLYSTMPKEQLIEKVNEFAKKINEAKSNEAEGEKEYLDKVNEVINQFKETVDKDDVRDTQFDDLSAAEEVVPMAPEMDGKMPDD